MPLCFAIAIGMLIVFGPGSEPSTFVTSFSSSVAETVVNATASRASLSLIVAIITGASDPIFALTVGLEL